MLYALIGSNSIKLYQNIKKYLVHGPHLGGDYIVNAFIRLPCKFAVHSHSNSRHSLWFTLIQNMLWTKCQFWAYVSRGPVRTLCPENNPRSVCWMTDHKEESAFFPVKIPLSQTMAGWTSNTWEIQTSAQSHLQTWSWQQMYKCSQLKVEVQCSSSLDQ